MRARVAIILVGLLLLGLACRVAAPPSTSETSALAIAPRTRWVLEGPISGDILRAKGATSERRTFELVKTKREGGALLYIITEQRDAQGRVVFSQEQEQTFSPDHVLSLSPMLTLDWEQHQEAWLSDPWTSEAAGIVEAQSSVNLDSTVILPDGRKVPAAVFSVHQVQKRMESLSYLELERTFTYTKEEGILVGVTVISRGTLRDFPADSSLELKLVEWTIR
jgi:hypothetical protein